MTRRIKQEHKFKKNFAQFVYSLFLDLRYGGKLLDSEKESQYFSRGCYHTQSVEYEELKHIFNDYEIKKDDILLDVGCGRGRIFNFLLSKGLKNKMIGVEIDKEIADFTKKRLRRYDNIEIVNDDILEYNRKDVTIFFLFCPFDETLTERFFNIIEERYDNVKIIYYHPQFIDNIKLCKDWKITYKEFYSNIRRMKIKCAYMELHKAHKNNNDNLGDAHK